jgi:hypothetical protein
MLPVLHLGTPTMARYEVNNQFLTGWRQRITGFLTVTAVIMLGIVYGAMMLGLIIMASIGFMAKWVWSRRLHRQTGSDWKATIIEGEYRVLQQSIGRRDDSPQR